MQLAFSIQGHELIDEGACLRTFGLLEAELAGIRRLEGDPQEDEAGVHILRFPVRTFQPAQRAMDPDA